jgi:hypothetical protein
MKIFLKYGLLYALGAILWTMITYVTGMDRMKSFNVIGLLSMVIPITCIYLGIKEKRDTELKGFISYGTAFNLGLSITAVATSIYAVFSFFYFKFINPGIIDFQKNLQYERLQERGMDELQIEKSLSFSEPFMSVTGFTITGFIVTFLIGIIISLIIAAILKKPDPEEIS